MSTDAFEQLIDVAAPGGGSYPVQRGHRRGVRSPHTFDAARWPPSSLTSPYAPQGSTTAVLIVTGGVVRRSHEGAGVVRHRRVPGGGRAHGQPATTRTLCQPLAPSGK